MEHCTLNSGHQMPIVGFGTWMAKDNEMEETLQKALEVGYRHIDTAFTYENEGAIGEVLQKWMSAEKLKREDLFIVTKLPPSAVRPESVAKYLYRSLASLQLDYVDMYLIHTPFGFPEVDGVQFPHENGKILLDKSTDLVATWQEMENQYKAGKAKSIGVSNFNIDQMNRILDNCEITPANLQIELHLYLQQPKMVDFCKRNGIAVTAYSPLGNRALKNMLQTSGKGKNVPDLLTDPTVQELAKKYSKTEAQIVLRHLVQNGIAVIPKSSNAARMRENFSIFDFELAEDDMQILNACDLDEAGRIVDFAMLEGVQEHPEYPFAK